MATIDEKRVYADRTGKTEVYVAAPVGVVAVDVSGDQIGGFGIDHRCAARDVAADGGRLAVATDEDVLVRGADGYEPTGFGPAVAVGFDGAALAADEGGRVARRVGDEGGDEWETVGRVGGGDGDVRAIDGSLVAAADGVYRAGDELEYTGLDDARDASADGVPQAATADGLYSLGNGWMEALDGGFRAVDAGGERAHAAADEGTYARVDGSWARIDLPTDEPIVDLAHGGGAAFALTGDGTLLVSAGERTDADADAVWRAQTLGLAGASGVAVG